MVTPESLAPAIADAFKAALHDGLSIADGALHAARRVVDMLTPAAVCTTNGCHRTQPHDIGHCAPSDAEWEARNDLADAPDPDDFWWGPGAGERLQQLHEDGAA